MDIYRDEINSGYIDTLAFVNKQINRIRHLAKLLIDKGADVNAKDNWDWTPLHSAVYKDKEMVDLLITRGANVDAKDGAARTPLWYAEKNGHTEIVNLLRKHGAKE